LFRATRIRSHIEELGHTERRWIELFDEHDGVIAADELLQLQRDEDRAISLRRLTTRALVMPGPFDGYVPDDEFDVTDPVGPLWCPQSIRLLVGNHSVAPLLQPCADDDIVHPRLADRRVIEHDLMTMAGQLSQAPVRRLKSGFPGKRFLSRVAAQLRDPRDMSGIRRMECAGYALLLYELLDFVGVLRTRHDRVTTSSRVDDLFCSDAGERMRTLLDAWQNATWYNELYQISDLALERDFPDYEHGDGKIDDLPTRDRLRSAREILLRLAGSLPPGEWVSLGSVVYAVYIQDDVFLMRQPQNYHYSHAPLYHGVWPADESSARGAWSSGLERAGNWATVEGAFVREIFANSLRYLGVLDVAETTGGDEVVRLTELGAWLLADGPRPDLEVPPGGALVVQPNFDVIVFPEGQDVGLLWPLMQATETISRDVTLTLRLTADSIYRATQRGLPGESVVEMLRSYARTPIPDNVQQAMSDWDQRYQQVSITTFADAVEADSVAEFDEFLSDVNSGQNVVRRISPTIGIVTGAISKLPPMTVLDYTKPLPAAISVGDELDVRVDPARENWTLRPTLEEIAEHVGDDRYLITPESAAEALTGDQTYDGAVGFLRAASPVDLSLRALFRLQGLFGHTGAVSVGDVTIVQVSRESVLNRMLGIDEFRDVLLQRIGPTTALVSSGRVDDLYALLDQYGIADDPTGLAVAALPPHNVSEHRRADSAAPESNGRRLQTYSSRKTRELLEEAIRQKRRVRIYYKPHTGGRMQERTVDPLGVERRHGVAYLTAYCHLRGEVQVFRIPSIDRVEVLPAG